MSSKDAEWFAAAPAGEVVSVPLPAMDDEPGRHDPSRCSAWTTVPEGKCTCPREPVPVPPPVDALSKLAKDVDYLVGGLPAYDWNADAAATRIKTAARDLWAAGVEEGRRQLVPQDAYEAGIYDAGIAEGRRQATEERTEEADRLHALLEHAERYARDLQDNGDVPQSTPVADLLRVEVTVRHPVGTELLGSHGVQRLLDQLGVVKAGDTSVRADANLSDDDGNSYVIYTVPVKVESHG